jgi:hypothetical protein
MGAVQEFKKHSTKPMIGHFEGGTVEGLRKEALNIYIIMGSTHWKQRNRTVVHL